MSRYKIYILLLSIFFNSYSLAHDKNQQWADTIMSVHDALIVTPIPADWQLKPAHAAWDDNFYLVEFLPKNQTVQKWKKMITVSGYKNAPVTPKEYFTSLYAMTQEVCGKQNTAGQIIEEKPDMLLALLMCGNPANKPGVGGLEKGQGEMILYRIYKVNNDLYSIFHSWRGKSYNVKDESDVGLPTSISNMGKYMNQSKSTLICNKNKPKGRCKEVVALVKKES